MADIDILQIKIEKARAALPEQTLRAIDSVPWKITLLEMRQEKGWSIEQLGDLELETELLLCGLLSTEQYPKELETRLKLPKAQVEALINELNESIFKKIKETLIKNTEKKDVAPTIVQKQTIAPQANIESREDMLKAIEQEPDLTKKELPSGHPILGQKLFESFKIPTVKTEHTIENITKPSTGSPKGGVDPYREIPQ